MKIVLLVIYSEGDPIYDKMLEVQRKYIHNYDTISTYFVMMKENLEDDVVINGDFIYVKGKESLLNILEKTIKALDYLVNVQKLEFDFFIRSNISTIINIPSLIKYLSHIPKTNIYRTGYRCAIQSTNVEYGITDIGLYGLYFASGTSIVMSNDIFSHMLSNKNTLRYDIIDDVAIGLYVSIHFPFLNKTLDTNVIPGVIIHDTMEKSNIKPERVFYRHKITKNRENNIESMNYVLDVLSWSNDKPKLKMILRGHIRYSFDNDDLYAFMKRLTNICDLEVYIHTWTVKSNNISWRITETDNTPVSESLILYYFKDLSKNIRKIIIDDETTIQHSGNIRGKIGVGPCPLIGWKNMWYGKYSIIDSMRTSNLDSDSLVINTRFDICNFFDDVFINEKNIYNKIKSVLENGPLYSNLFLRNSESEKIDNFYIGTIETLYKLAKHFHHNMDAILEKYPDIFEQERLVFRESCSLLSPKILLLFIYSEGDPIYEKMLEIQRKYIHNYSNVSSYFVIMKENLETDFAISGDFIYIKGKESLLNILEKTVKSLEYLIHVQKLEFDFMIRSNISTIINIPRIQYHFSTLPRKNVYSGGNIVTINSIDYKSGITDEYLYGTKYVNGTSIILSHDICCHILQNRTNLRYDIVDDVSIGYYISNYLPNVLQTIDKYATSLLKTCDENITVSSPNYSFYRNKYKFSNYLNRNYDIGLMQHIYNLLYAKSQYTHKFITMPIEEINQHYDSQLWYEKMKQFANKVPHYNPTNNDYGVVICAGDRHFVSAFITIQMVLLENPTIQIEWYYVGNELIGFQKKLLQNIPNIRLIDCIDIIPSWFPEPITENNLKGFMIKPFALMMSQFENILLIDGDNTPTCKIESLFHNHFYQKYGNVFWKDITFDSEIVNKNLLKYGYSIYNVMKIPHPYKKGYGLTESGQVLVNKSKCYLALCLSYYLNYHHDTFYKLFFGDKDLYYMAFQLTNTPYYQCPFTPFGLGIEREPKNNISALIQRHPYDGSPAFVHRTLSKITIQKIDKYVSFYENMDVPASSNDDLSDLRLYSSSVSKNLNDLVTNYQNAYLYIWNKLKHVYKDNINDLLNYYKENIQASIAFSDDIYKITNSKLLQNSLCELQLYVTNNLFHSNCVLIYKLYSNNPHDFVSFLKDVVTYVKYSDETVYIANTFILKYPLFLPHVLEVLPNKHRIFLLINANNHNILSSIDVGSILLKTGDVFLKYMGILYSNINSSSILNSVLDKILESPEIIYTFDFPIYISIFYHTSFTNNNNRIIKEKISALHRKMYPSINTVNPSVQEKQNESINILSRKKRIGFISTNFKNHSVCRDRCGVICNMNKDLFDVFVFYFSFEREHYYFNKLYSAGHNNILLSGSFDQWKKTIVAANLDILVYCDIGMQAETYFLAHSRFAPIQMNTWGHSETSGIDTLDYYVSSKWYEIDSAQDHYSEKLLAHDSLCTFYYPHIYHSMYEGRDKSLLLLENEKYLLFPHYLHKISAIDLQIFKKILQLTGPSLKIAFIDGNSGALDNKPHREKILAELAAYEDRIFISSNLKTGNFYDLIKRSYLVLDCFPHGSCNAALECFYFNKLLITLPSAYLRGRFAQGFYRKMGITDCIVTSPEKYVEKVLELLNNESYKDSLEMKISSNKHVLFCDVDTISDWNKMLYELQPNMVQN